MQLHPLANFFGEKLSKSDYIWANLIRFGQNQNHRKPTPQKSLILCAPWPQKLYCDHFH